MAKDLELLDNLPELIEMPLNNIIDIVTLIDAVNVHKEVGS